MITDDRNYLAAIETIRDAKDREHQMLTDQRDTGSVTSIEAANYLIGDQLSNLMPIWLDDSLSETDFWMFFQRNQYVHCNWYFRYILRVLDATNTNEVSIKLISFYSTLRHTLVHPTEGRKCFGVTVTLAILTVATIADYWIARRVRKSFEWKVSTSSDFIHPSVLDECLRRTELAKRLGKDLFSVEDLIFALKQPSGQKQAGGD